MIRTFENVNGNEVDFDTKFRIISKMVTNKKDIETNSLWTHIDLFRGSCMYEIR